MSRRRSLQSSRQRGAKRGRGCGQVSFPEPNRAKRRAGGIERSSRGARLEAEPGLQIPSADNGPRAMILPDAATRQRGGEQATERIRSKDLQGSEEAGRERRPRRGGHQPGSRFGRAKGRFEQPAPSRSSAVPPPGALIRRSQKPRWGAKGESAADPEATLGPSMPAGEQAATWVTWNHFLCRCPSGDYSGSRSAGPAAARRIALLARSKADEVVPAVLAPPGVGPQAQQQAGPSRSVVILQGPASQVHAPTPRAAGVARVFGPPRAGNEAQVAIAASQRPDPQPAPKALPAIAQPGVAEVIASTGRTVQHDVQSTGDICIVAIHRRQNNCPIGIAPSWYFQTTAREATYSSK